MIARPIQSRQQFLTTAKDAIVTVGAGRGFLFADLVITAAHCLPELPPAMTFSHARERTYRNLLGPIGVPPTVSAECVFVDPIGDLAVLASPDSQSLFEEADGYEGLLGVRPTLQIGTIDHSCPVWLLTLNGEWEQCNVEVSTSARYLTLVNAKDGNMAGVSGSPIVTKDGTAIGIVVTGSEEPQEREHGQPLLVSNLPGWMLAQIDAMKGGA